MSKHPFHTAKLIQKRLRSWTKYFFFTVLPTAVRFGAYPVLLFYGLQLASSESPR